MSTNMGGAQGYAYFGQSFTNLQSIQMFSFYVAPDDYYGNYVVQTQQPVQAAIMEWDEQGFYPTNVVWTGATTLGTQAGNTPNTIVLTSPSSPPITFSKVTVQIGSTLPLDPSKTYLLAMYYLAVSDYDYYLIASTEGSGQAYWLGANFPPAAYYYWSYYQNEGEFIYEIIVGNCDAAPCQNEGTCIGQDTCSCADGYFGDVCQNAICDQECANGGTCTSHNFCTCQSGWAGSDCTTAICDPACVNGACTRANECTCNSGWQGLLCDVPGCDAATTCAGYGSCNPDGTCACLGGYDPASNCGSCAAGYFGYPNCQSDALFPSMPVVLPGIEGRFNITVEWGPANTSTTDSYTLAWFQDGNWITLYQGANLSYVVGLLTPNTTYQFRLSATNAYGASDFVSFSLSTIPADVPSPPKPPSFNQYSRSFIHLNWNPPSSDGGLPVLGFILRMLNFSSYATWNVSSLQYKAIGLKPNTNYQFSIAAYNQIGSSPFSPSINISTAPIMCGDGVCDATESCSSCFLDCGACAYNPCPGEEPCNGRGTCVKGLCNCLSFWYGDACQYQENLPVQVKLNTTTGFVLQNATSNASVSFDIFFTSIREVDTSGKIVKEFDLNFQNVVAKKYENSSATNYVYNVILPNRATVTIYASVYRVPTVVKFANENIQIPKNGLKYVMRIDNWPFAAIANRLIMSMRANATAQGGDDDCATSNTVATNDANSENLRSLAVKINGVTLYGKFMEKAYFDDVIQSVQFHYNDTAGGVDIEMPHFWSYVELDPNFQVLLDPTDHSSDNTGCISNIRTGTKNKHITGKVVGGVFGALFGTAVVVSVVYYFYGKHSKAKMTRMLSEGHLPSTLSS